MDRRRRTAVARMVVTVSLTAALAACGPQGPADQPAPPSESAVSTTPIATVAPEDLLEQAVRNTIDAPSKRLVGLATVSAGSQEFDITYLDGNARGTQTSRAMGLESVVELDQGRNAYTGTGHELMHDPKVIELYLGTLARVK